MYETYSVHCLRVAGESRAYASTSSCACGPLRARHDAVRRTADLDLEHYLDVLSRKPGALAR